jgi:hypothetical protein
MNRIFFFDMGLLRGERRLRRRTIVPENEVRVNGRCGVEKFIIESAAAS